MRDYHKKMDRRMFDFAQFYWDIAKWMPQDAVIAEVGVAEGASAIYLAETLMDMEKNFTFYLIDDLSYGGHRQLHELLKHIVRAGIGERVTVMPFSSLDAACRFPDNQFDFVFIDASHKCEATKADIQIWYQKVKDGRYLAGHDYNDGEGAEVKMAVKSVVPRHVLDGEVKVDAVQIEHTSGGCNVWKILKRPNLKMKAY